MEFGFSVALTQLGASWAAPYGALLLLICFYKQVVPRGHLMSFLFRSFQTNNITLWQF